MHSNIYQLEFLSNTTIESHLHQDLEILYVLKGSAGVQIGEQRHHLSTNDFFLINSRQHHSLEISSSSLVGSFHLPYDMFTAYTGCENFIINISYDSDKQNALDEIKLIIEGIFSASSDRKNNFALQSLFYKLLDILTKRYLVKIEGDISHENTNNRLLEIKDYINNNYYQEISLKDLASRLFLSISYLSKYFKNQFGMTFLQYINEVRLEHALSDIRYTGKPISRIASQVGFSNLRTFNKVFQEKYNLTPAAYRRSFRNNTENETLIQADGRRPVQPQPERIFEADKEQIDSIQVMISDQPQGNLTNYWSSAINVGTADDLLLSDIQQHVLKLKSKLNFKYARFWSLYTKTMYLNYHEIGKKYNFNRLDRILDFLIANQIKPLIEIANKNKILSHSSTTKRHTAPSETNLYFSKELMAYFFGELAAHLVERYGREEVSSWLFEFWMEENEHSFYRRIVFAEDIQRHVELFTVVSSAMRKVLGNIKIGTGGFSLHYDRHCLGNIITALANAEERPDFLSFYAFPLAKPDEVVKLQKITINPDFIKERVTDIRDFIDNSQLRRLPLMITEWNITSFNHNIINDSVYKGAFIMKNIIDSKGSLDMMSYWMASDLYSDYFEDNIPLFGASGLLSKNGFTKPAYHALVFMNALRPIFFSKGSNHLVSGDGKGSWAIVCHNHKALNHYYYAVTEENVRYADLQLIMADNKPLRLNLMFEKCLNRSYRVKTYVVNQSHGSVQDEWVRMLEPERLDTEDIEYLEDVSSPNIKVQYIQPQNGQLQINTILDPNEIQLILVVPS